MLAAAALWPMTASASPKTYECQKPLITGVEVYTLRHMSADRACPVALALFAWENASAVHANKLYGCHFPKPGSGGYPYLRLHRFDRWTLSLSGRPYGAFVMSRGERSFRVTGTDFPLNCS
jgi:hypothetical protein